MELFLANLHKLGLSFAAEFVRMGMFHAIVGSKSIISVLDVMLYLSKILHNLVRFCSSL